MPHVKTNRTSTLGFTRDDQTWIVDRGVSVAVNNDSAVLSTWANSTLINYGKISASGVGAIYGVTFKGDGGSITNSGRISCASPFGGAIFIDTFSDTTTVVRNLQGGIIKGVGGAILCGDGNERIVNAGRIGDPSVGDGYVNLGGGNDVFINFMKIGTKVISGTVWGVIDLSTGDDTLRGGSKTEKVQDSGGSDTYKLGGGNDEYNAIAAAQGLVDGNDIVSGGRGIDVYNAFSATNDLQINLDNVAHTDVDTVAANTAQGIDISGGFVFKDTVTGFEYAVGGAGHDQIFGNKAANILQGGGGPDGLFGFGGNDQLDGGDGADTLVGGKGADVLDSGVGDFAADSFLFLSLRDSTAAKAGRDVINFFEDTLDIIKLDAIDANTKNGGTTNEAFQFLGVDQLFTNDPGGLRVMTKDYGWLIQADVNGDKKADFAIKVLDQNHTISWSADDFVL